MPNPSLIPDIAELVVKAAQAFEPPEGALERLNDLCKQASGALECAVYEWECSGEVIPRTRYGSRLLADAALMALRAAGPEPAFVPVKRPPSGIHARVIITNGERVGAWTAELEPGVDPARWQTIASALAPLAVLALQQRLWREEVELAKSHVERRIREVSTVYEIGRAIEKVGSDELLHLIAEQAVVAMDAQACCLMLPQGVEFAIVASYGVLEDIAASKDVLLRQGAGASAVNLGEPLLLQEPDVTAGVAMPPSDCYPASASSIIVPMKDDAGSVIGVLSVRRSGSTPPFNHADLRLFSIFAAHALLAIDNSRLYHQLNNRLQELSTISALTETISSTLDLDQVLNQVADSIVEVLQFDLCRIYLSDIDTGRYSARIVRGFPPARGQAGGEKHGQALSPGSSAPIHDANIGLGEGLVGLVALQQTPLLVNNLDTAAPVARQYAQYLGLTRFHAQPIVLRGRCIGVVVVSHSDLQTPFVQSNVDLLSTFVHQAGIAIENARFYAGQERRYSELATLYEVSRTLAATSGVNHAAATVNDLATRITESDAGILLYFERNKDAMRPLHWRGVSEAMERRLRSAVATLPVPATARDVCVSRVLSAEVAGTIFGPEWRPIFESFLLRHRSVALVPLVVDNAAVGFIVLGKHRAEYGVEELKLIAIASSQAATVLRSASDYERRIGQRDLELSAVYELMQKVRAATTLDEALSSILSIVATLVWSERSALYTVDTGSRNLSMRAYQSNTVPAGLAEHIPMDGNSIPARALRERRALISEDSPDNIVHSTLAIPLVVGDEMVGVLTLECEKPNIYTEENVMMLHLVTSQAATIYREMSSFRVLTRYTENILRSIAAGVITIDKDGYIVTLNARVEAILNLPADRILGLHSRDFIERLQIEPAVRDQTMRMVALAAHTDKVITRNQLCYHSPQGDETYVNLTASQLKSESGEYLGVVVVFEDITHEIQMKEEVVRIGKLAETGQLAANIAHELRNPLSSIKGAAQILRNDLPEEYIAEHGEFLDIIIEEVNGLNRITTEFLEFSRINPPQMADCDVNNLIGRLAAFMGPYLKESKVTIDLQFDDGLPSVRIDKTQIEQVVRNIIINAAQAMPEGGKLTVRTHHFVDQDIVDVQFIDTGVGIPAVKLEKIFTPFFTTKTKGTGLGLSIARKIVDTHGGRLTARSTLGEGSVFVMQLPVHPHIGPVMPPAHTEITEQRSDRPGGSFRMTQADVP
ncbi:MAG: GAF domain-containing protein [Capsulimonadaceae bacterium]